MNNLQPIVKGIHPGLIVARELEKRHLGKSKFAISLQEYPQTFSAITSGKRGMNTRLALKIEKALGMEEGYLMVLQAYYDIKKEKQKQAAYHHPDFSKLRRVLFWDTDMKKINWQEQKRAVIMRVFERGNDEEKREITSFYGEEEVSRIIHEKR